LRDYQWRWSKTVVSTWLSLGPVMYGPIVSSNLQHEIGAHYFFIYGVCNKAKHNIHVNKKKTTILV